MNIFSEIYGTYFRIAAKLLGKMKSQTKRRSVKQYRERASGTPFSFCLRSSSQAVRTGDFSPALLRASCAG